MLAQRAGAWLAHSKATSKVSPSFTIDRMNKMDRITARCLQILSILSPISRSALAQTAKLRGFLVP